MGLIRLGCSGWDYRDWADVFYKRDDESKLKAYSSIFNTAEINSTFYSYPAPGMVFGWANHTPPDFKFSVKLNRLITHEKLLEISKGVEDDLKRFCELLRPLHEAEKLACILIQLPPGMKFRKDKMDDFLRRLPSDHHFALEFRNKTWLAEDAYHFCRIIMWPRLQWMSRCCLLMSGLHQISPMYGGTGEEKRCGTITDIQRMNLLPGFPD